MNNEVIIRAIIVAIFFSFGVTVISQHDAHARTSILKRPVMKPKGPRIDNPRPKVPPGQRRRFDSDRDRSLPHVPPAMVRNPEKAVPYDRNAKPKPPKRSVLEGMNETGIPKAPFLFGGTRSRTVRDLSTEGHELRTCQVRLGRFLKKVGAQSLRDELDREVENSSLFAATEGKALKTLLNVTTSQCIESLHSIGADRLAERIGDLIAKHPEHFRKRKPKSKEYQATRPRLGG